jgi:hypothetical protein
MIGTVNLERKMEFEQKETKVTKQRTYRAIVSAIFSPVGGVGLSLKLVLLVSFMIFCSNSSRFLGLRF